MPASARLRIAVANEINRLPLHRTIVEAGSGWGTLALHLVRHCPGIQVTGIENSPVPWWFSRLLARLHVQFQSKAVAATRSSLAWVYGDMYDYDFESADVVVCYLYPGAMKQLSEVLSERLLPGTRIISICFVLPGWRAERVITCSDLFRTPIYIYVVE
ncbi:hypothetical protein D3C73_437260 [compost metagenome]